MRRIAMALGVASLLGAMQAEAQWAYPQCDPCRTQEECRVGSDFDCRNSEICRDDQRCCYDASDHECDDGRSMRDRGSMIAGITVMAVGAAGVVAGAIVTGHRITGAGVRRLEGASPKRDRRGRGAGFHRRSA